MQKIIIIEMPNKKEVNHEETKTSQNYKNNILYKLDLNKMLVQT